MMEDAKFRTVSRQAAPPAPGVTRLGDAEVSVYVVADPGGLVLVDGGLPGAPPAAAVTPGRHRPGLALVHGYDTAFWWTAGFFAGGAIIGGLLLRRGPLVPAGAPAQAHGEVPTTKAKAGPRPSA